MAFIKISFFTGGDTLLGLKRENEKNAREIISPERRMMSGF